MLSLQLLTSTRLSLGLPAFIGEHKVCAIVLQWGLRPYAFLVMLWPLFLSANILYGFRGSCCATVTRLLLALPPGLFAQIYESSFREVFYICLPLHDRQRRF